jgi:hypothetical protein
VLLGQVGAIWKRYFYNPRLNQREPGANQIHDWLSRKAALDVFSE